MTRSISIGDLYARVAELEQRVAVLEAAGASTRKDEEAATHGQSTPAADSAFVCEWRAGRDGIQAVAACGIPNNYWLETAKRLGVKTCACGRPIKLVEAK